jgi:hypothetical protein
VDQPFLVWFWLVLSALVAGAVNSLAGGGTLLTFPTLVAALAPLVGEKEAFVIANMTSTVALVPGSLAGAWGYRRELVPVRSWLVVLGPPSLLGGLCGSLLVARLDPAYFAALVPWLTLLAAVLFFMQPMLVRKTEEVVALHRRSRPHQAAAFVFQFFVGVYGGYFGAGIGILMLAAFGLMGLWDVHKMNALKTVLAAVINGVSVVVFIADGRIYWPFAGAMAVSAVVGGYLAARGARYLPRFLVRWTVIAAGLSISAYLFWKRAHSS